MDEDGKKRVELGVKWLQTLFGNESVIVQNSVTCPAMVSVDCSKVLRNGVGTDEVLEYLNSYLARQLEETATISKTRFFKNGEKK
jgi:hypothetical protein